MPRHTLTRSVHTARHGLRLFRSRKILGCMLRDIWHRDYAPSILTILILVVSVGYILFPFDIVPDIIPVLGWLDDGLVLYLLLRRMVKETQRYTRYKAMERKCSAISG